MKAKFLSRELSARRVFKNIFIILICLVGLLVTLLAGSYVKYNWYYPRLSVRILQTLNEKTQTIDEQLEIVNKAISLDHYNLEARFLIAKKLTEKKEYNDAARAWAYLGKHHTGRIGNMSFADQGMCHLFDNQHAKAISCLQEAIRRRPEYVSARVFLAATYADLDFQSRVEEELLLLANLDPNWQLPFETCPEWSEERKAVIEMLQPYLE